MSNSSSHSELIYETHHCISIQDDLYNNFQLYLFGQKITLKPCSLFALKSKIDKINLESIFYDENHPGIEIIALNCIGRVFVFTLSELIEVRELVLGTFSLLEINSVIHSQLIRK